MIYLSCKEIDGVHGAACWCRQSFNPNMWIKANVASRVGVYFDDICKDACCKIGGGKHDRFDTSSFKKPENGAKVGKSCKEK